MSKEIKKTEETEELTGVCRYCCQTRIVKGSVGMTEEEITEAATLSCSCEAAVYYQEKTRREKAAKKRVDELFGEAASGFNQDEAVLNYMKQGIDLINDGKIRNLTLNLNKGLKCKIAVMTDDKIKVSREIKSVVEFKQ